VSVEVHCQELKVVEANGGTSKLLGTIKPRNPSARSLTKLAIMNQDQRV
jgi:hypothetical protein